jgi:hypothetical protein
MGGQVALLGAEGAAAGCMGCKPSSPVCYDPATPTTLASINVRSVSVLQICLVRQHSFLAVARSFNNRAPPGQAVAASVVLHPWTLLPVLL